MKIRFAVAFRAAFVLAFCIATGCASQNQAIQASEPSKMALLADEPLLLAGDPPVAELENQNDADLLEDDWALLEDLEADQEFYTVADPLEPINRAIFTFNDRLYFWVIKPAAQGYRAVTPQPVRTGVQNFFNHIGTPIRLVNLILQGKLQSAEAEFAKFLYNSTAGVLGFGNPAKKYPQLNPDEEDFGQTLAVYHIGDGFFIEWPILGPKTLRDSFGTVGDWFLDPVFYYIDPLSASLSISAYRILNDVSFRIGDYEALKKAALDPYEAFRNAYIQLRQSKIKK